MKALILDDEPMPAKYLEQMIQKHCFEIKSMDLFNVASKALKELETEYYDIIFLDVEMPEMDGFQFLEKANLPSETQIVFTTAYSEYALEAFKTNARHYLVKPVTKEDLIMAVRKVSSAMPAKEPNTEFKDYISIYDGEEYLLLKKEEIIRFEADGSYTKVITTSAKNILSSKRLGEYEKKVDAKAFVRCHNSHLVNINFISKVSKGKGGFLSLKNGEVIPISTSKKEEINRLLN